MCDISIKPGGQRRLHDVDFHYKFPLLSSQARRDMNIKSAWNLTFEFEGKMDELQIKHRYHCFWHPGSGGTTFKPK